MKRILFIITFLGLNACQEATKHDEIAKDALHGLSDEQYAAIGYEVKSRGVVDQSDWEKEQFGIATATYSEIKSTTETKPGSQTYARFKIIRERYKDTDTAQKRFQRLRDFDPALITKFKNTDHDLRRGFCVGDEVIIVTTDAVLFSRHYLDEITAKLKKLEESK